MYEIWEEICTLVMIYGQAETVHDFPYVKLKEICFWYVSLKGFVCLFFFPRL